MSDAKETGFIKLNLHRDLSLATLDRVVHQLDLQNLLQAHFKYMVLFKMERTLQEGDLVIIETPTERLTLEIVALKPEGIYALAEDNYVLIKLINDPTSDGGRVYGEWKVYDPTSVGGRVYGEGRVYQYNVSFLPYPEEEYNKANPTIGDLAIMHIYAQKVSGDIVEYTPTQVVVESSEYNLEPGNPTDEEYTVNKIEGKWVVENYPDSYIVFAEDYEAYQQNQFVKEPSPGGVALIVLGEDCKKFEVVSVDPIIISDNNGQYIAKDYPRKNKIKFEMNPEMYLPYLKQRETYIPSTGFTDQTIQSSPIVGLLHYTDFKGLRGIINHGGLVHRLSNVAMASGLAGPYSFESTVQETAFVQGHFPGIYSYLITQYDVLRNILLNPQLDIQLILSPVLLKQQNWHFKITDKDAFYGYGTITNLAFGPDTLSKYLPEINEFWSELPSSNELIIHDPIPIHFVDMIVVKNKRIQNIVQHMLNLAGLQISVVIANRELNEALIKAGPILRDLPLSNEPPQYCYTGKGVSREIATFENMNPYTSQVYNPEVDQDEYIWQRRMHNCGLSYSPEQTPEERVQMIEQQMQKIYFEDAPRIPVSGEYYPPFKYTPEWYQSNDLQMLSM